MSQPASPGGDLFGLPPVGIRLKKNGSRKRRKTQPAIRHRNNDSRQHCLPPTSNGSSYCMTIRHSKVLRRRQCVKKIRAVRDGILDSQSAKKPGNIPRKRNRTKGYGKTTDNPSNLDRRQQISKAGFLNLP